ncbi:unnamed protein product [Heterobilharzia americana]|nr:unnamed protein product [Heterobilharzia americana]
MFFTTDKRVHSVVYIDNQKTSISFHTTQSSIAEEKFLIKHQKKVTSAEEMFHYPQYPSLETKSSSPDTTSLKNISQIPYSPDDIVNFLAFLQNNKTLNSPPSSNPRVSPYEHKTIPRLKELLPHTFNSGLIFPDSLSDVKQVDSARQSHSHNDDKPFVNLIQNPSNYVRSILKANFVLDDCEHLLPTHLQNSKPQSIVEESKQNETNTHFNALRSFPFFSSLSTSSVNSDVPALITGLIN